MTADYQLATGIAASLVGAVLIGFTKLRFQAVARLPGGASLGFVGPAPRPPTVTVATAGFARPWQWWTGWGLMVLGYCGQLLSALGCRMF